MRDVQNNANDPVAGRAIFSRPVHDPRHRRWVRRWRGPLAAPTLGCASLNALAAPNIFFIIADDVGIGDLGPYGQQTIHTPSIDQLTCDGVTVTQMYSGTPACSPSPAVLMTGLHNGRHVNGNGDSLQAGHVTVAEVLKAQGYVTAVFGKWHLGGGATSCVDPSRSISTTRD